MNTNKQNNEAHLCCFSSSRNWSDIVPPLPLAGLFVIAVLAITIEAITIFLINRQAKIAAP